MVQSGVENIALISEIISVSDVLCTSSDNKEDYKMNFFLTCNVSFHCLVIVIFLDCM